jgi:hypothetical protein
LLPSIVEIAMRKMRAGTIQKKSNAAIFPAVQRSLTSLTAKPTRTQGATARRGSVREVKALLLLNHMPAIQIEWRGSAVNGSAPDKPEPAAAARNLTPAARLEFGHDEIAHLAYLNWQKEGCPSGRALDYWLEAECQLKATWHLLVAAGAAAAAAEANPCKCAGRF